MEQYTSRQEREGVEAKFDAFMKRTIKYYARNITRKISADEDKRRSIPIDSLGDKAMGFLAVEDVRHIEDGIVLEADLRIKVTDEQVKELLAGLTERESQILILRTVFDLDYDVIAQKLHITEERAKAYKYHGVIKAKEREKGNGDEDKSKL